MKINLEKLNKYLENEEVLEFESDVECAEYFNKYDYPTHPIKTKEELIEYQGRYGFEIGERRYHIQTEQALEIFENDFTDEEFYILSDAMLCLIRNTNDAIRLLWDAETIRKVEETRAKYQELTTKVCKCLI